jgi:hypothetical protein
VSGIASSAHTHATAEPKPIAGRPCVEPPREGSRPTATSVPSAARNSASPPRTSNGIRTPPPAPNERSSDPSGLNAVIASRRARPPAPAANTEPSGAATIAPKLSSARCETP